MSFAGYLFLIAGFLLAVVAGQKSRMRRVSAVALPVLYIYHIGMSFYYWLIATSSIADASAYYAESAYPTQIGISNDFIIWILYIVKSTLDRISYGTMLDYFILFSIFGFTGLIYLYNSLAEIFFQDEKKIRAQALFLLLICIFSPGLNFWTSAIGKDSLIFLGICMVTYALPKWRKRWLHLAIGMFVVFMVRPYILVFAALAGLLQFFIAGKISIAARVAGLLIIALAAVLFGPTIVEFTQVGSVDVIGVRDYIEVRQGQNLESGSSINIANYNFVFQVLTYLFRPLFFDAGSATALAASFDNALLLALVLLTLVNARYFAAKILAHPPILLNFLFAAAGVSALAMTTASLGIAVRQKTMFLPSLLIVIAWSLQHAHLRRAARRQLAREHAARLNVQRDTSH